MMPLVTGPIRHATVVCHSLGAVLPAYQNDLGLKIVARERLTPDAAAAIGLQPGLDCAWLASAHGRRWLRLVQQPDAVHAAPWSQHGWLALEVLVDDPDRLVAGLGAGWRVLGPPADLEMSADIRAAQVLGPSGELVYFTQVKAPVPPFDLPQTQHRVDGPFVAVMTCADREASLAEWETLTGARAMRFDTRISVLNRALDQPSDTRHALAVLPLEGRHLIEIDEVALPQTADDDDRPRSGLHSIAIECAGLAAPTLWRGRHGERVECLPPTVQAPV